jgi:hypothetical protein
MREAIQCRLELVPRGFILVAVEADRGAANALNDCENRLAFLAADRIAKNAAEKPDIVTQRQILVGSLEHIHDHTNSSYAAADRAPPLNRDWHRLLRADCGLMHHSKTLRGPGVNWFSPPDALVVKRLAD